MEKKNNFYRECRSNPKVFNKSQTFSLQKCHIIQLRRKINEFNNLLSSVYSRKCWKSTQQIISYRMMKIEASQKAPWTYMSISLNFQRINLQQMKIVKFCLYSFANLLTFFFLSMSFRTYTELQSRRQRYHQKWRHSQVTTTNQKWILMNGADVKRAKKKWNKNESFFSWFEEKKKTATEQSSAWVLKQFPKRAICSSVESQLAKRKHMKYLGHSINLNKSMFHFFCLPSSRCDCLLFIRYDFRVFLLFFHDNKMLEWILFFWITYIYNIFVWIFLYSVFIVYIFVRFLF